MSTVVGQLTVIISSLSFSHSSEGLVLQLLSELHHYGSILSTVVGRPQSLINQFPELPTTVVEAWYCYCSVDSIIMDLHVFSIAKFCHCLTHNHYQFPELPTTVVEAWYCYCSVDFIIMDLFCQLSLVDSQSFFQFPELLTTVVRPGLLLLSGP